MRSLNTCVVLEFRVDSSFLSMDGLQYFQTLTMNSIGLKKNPGMSTKKLVFSEYILKDMQRKVIFCFYCGQEKQDVQIPLFIQIHDLAFKSTHTMATVQ